MRTVLYLCWENQEDRKHRILHIFGNHKDAYEFINVTDGLREWNPNARYYARDHEVESHDSNLVIHHDK